MTAPASPRTVHAQVLRTALRGHFSEHPFPEVLGMAYKWNATGALCVSQHRFRKIIYLEGGVPVAVRSNRTSDCLGRLLLRERLIREQDCVASTEQAISTHRLQGHVLVEMGALSTQNLASSLERQMREKLLDVCSWQHGDYVFVPGARPQGTATSAPMPLLGFLLDATRHSFAPAHIARWMGPLEGVYPARVRNDWEAFDASSLSEDDRALLWALDGRSNITELAEATDNTPQDVACFVYAMQCANWVEFVHRRVPGPLGWPSSPPEPRALGNRF
ncbi:MAG: DUF4388 domain-containing protein [Myxococcaceae bacterium]